MHFFKNKVYFIILFFVLIFTNQLIGGIPVTFQLDLKDLINKGVFSSDSGDKVYIRGSFNNWTGNDYELDSSSDGYIYKNEFYFNSGDTVYYKYVICKGPDQSYWEHNPNPENPDYGNRILVTGDKGQVLSPVQFAYDEYINYPVIFSKKKLQDDFSQFRYLLESVHPALYDYTPKNILDSLFDTNYNKINTDLDFNTFIMLLTNVISKVGCGHSSLFVPDQFWIVAPEKLFPLKLIMINNKIFVKGFYSNKQSIPVGSEIISINGEPVNKIIDHLASLISADGFNSSYRYTKAVENFSVKYALTYGFPDNFRVDYQKYKSKKKTHKQLQPVAKQTIDRENIRPTELSFKISNNGHLGILSINTFGYYGEVEMFRGFIDSVFTEIYQKNISNLILDLRKNDGGDPFCASYLWGYLEPAPLPYFKDHYGKYDALADPIPIAKYNYKGKLYTLIDGNGLSTTGHFCGLLKYHHVGQFIGSELGSTYTCTGNAMYPPLMNTGIIVGTARERRYTAAVKNMDPKRGVIPDIHVEPTINDIIHGRDTVMEYAISLTDN